MLEMVLERVESENLKLIPSDRRVKSYLRKHTAWQRLLLKGVQV
jgi:hypothetical protein